MDRRESPHEAGAYTASYNQSMRWLAALVLVSFSAPALASDVVIPPMPDSWKRTGDKWSWERAVKRCAERQTEWARDRCIRGLYER
jgi:hypothetical protein